MPTSSVAARSLLLAVFGLGAASASAQTANVIAFDPYNGVGLSGRAPMAGPANSPMAIPVIPMQPGPAFNPWRPAGTAAGPSVPPIYGGYGAGLPPPPPGPIESRVIAIPQRGDPYASPRASYTPPTPQPRSVAPATAAPVPITPPPAASPPPTPVLATPAPPAPPPTPPVIVHSDTASPPPPTPVPQRAPAPPTPPTTMATTAPEPTPPPPSGSPITSVVFVSQSAEISAQARAELDRFAKTAAAGGMRQIELRAYAGGADAAESRKVSLARALAVRSYLIDQGVKARIEIGAFAASGDSAGGDRVDVLAPNP